LFFFVTSDRIWWLETESNLSFFNSDRILHDPVELVDLWAISCEASTRSAPETVWGAAHGQIGAPFF
jgi:hypothetical protein